MYMYVYVCNHQQAWLNHAKLSVCNRKSVHQTNGDGLVTIYKMNPSNPLLIKVSNLFISFYIPPPIFPLYCTWVVSKLIYGPVYEERQENAGHAEWLDLRVFALIISTRCGYSSSCSHARSANIGRFNLLHCLGASDVQAQMTLNWSSLYPWSG